MLRGEPEATFVALSALVRAFSRRSRGRAERRDGASACCVEIGPRGVGGLETGERIDGVRVQAPCILAAWRRQTRREGIQGDRGCVVDRLGQRAQLLRRLEALLQGGGPAAELLHPFPVAPAGRDARLLQAALGLLPFAGDTPVPRFGKEGRQQLSSAKQIEIAEKGVSVGGSREQSDDCRRL